MLWNPTQELIRIAMAGGYARKVAFDANYRACEPRDYNTLELDLKVDQDRSTSDKGENTVAT